MLCHFLKILVLKDFLQTATVALVRIAQHVKRLLFRQQQSDAWLACLKAVIFRWSQLAMFTIFTSKHRT